MHLLLNDYGKILYDDNSVFSDITREMKDWVSGTKLIPLTKTEDYIYIGMPHTFASRFFHIKAPNDIASALTIEYYYGGNNWRAVKNVADETRSGAITMAQSGFISWDLPTDWVRNQVNSQPELPYGDSTADGHGFYWIRIKASETLKATTELFWLGVIWTNHKFMEARWQEVTTDTYLPSGKTDWYELIEMSTRDVGDDLKISNVIEYEMQAKDISELATLTALKTMVNILIPMQSSETLRLMKDEFDKQYQKLLKKRISSVDQDGDETLNAKEQKPMYNGIIQRY